MYSTQEDVLDCDARVRVVSASPGSGKTWLVAEAIRREIGRWDQVGGIAAVSFTNVARDEIARAMGCVPSTPNFVGTIDSFVYRHILRPFSHFIGLPVLRLIAPDSAKAFSSQFDSVPVGKTRVSIFDVNFVGEDQGRPLLSARTRYQGQVLLSGTDAERGIKMKESLWSKRKCLSSSDTIWLATKILRHNPHGPFIRRFLARRFPLLIVDELQDTGWFLGQVIRAILAEDGTRGLLVGDPDQAIYAFNGARPDLFDEFLKLPGAKRHEIPYTRRCSDSVCATAKHLRQSGNEFTRQTPLAGRSTLLVYGDAVGDLDKVRHALSTRGGAGKSAIVTRKNADARAIAKVSEPTPPKFGPVCLKLLHGATNRLLLGEMAQAYALARGALTYGVLSDASPTEEALVAAGVTPQVLRSEAVNLLLAASRRISGEDLFAWGIRVKTLLEGAYARNGWLERESKVAPKIKNPFTKLRGIGRDQHLATRGAPNGTEVQTVHAVKGETHEVTVLYVPNPKGPDACPSTVWWSGKVEEREERRVAYVAATRPRTEFVLAVSAATRDRLAEMQPDFFKTFEQMSVDQYLGRIERA